MIQEPNNSKETLAGSFVFLRPSDQRVTAMTVLALLVFFGAVCGWSASRSGGWVHYNDFHDRSIPFTIDLNRANWSELSALPHIGESTSRLIIQYRTEFGEFESLRDLMAIDGIGLRTVQDLRPHVVDLPYSRQLIAESK